jgi:hypothetical protein
MSESTASKSWSLLLEYLQAVLRHSVALMTGSLPLAVYEVLTLAAPGKEHLWNHPPPWLIWLSVLIAVTAAQFRAWLDIRKKRDEARKTGEDRLREKAQALDAANARIRELQESEDPETVATTRLRIYGPHLLLNVKNWSLRPSSFRVALRKEDDIVTVFKCPWADKEDHTDQVSLLWKEAHDAVIAQFRPDQESGGGQWCAPARRTPSHFNGQPFSSSDTGHEPDSDSAQQQALDIVITLLADPPLRHEFSRVVRLVWDRAYEKTHSGGWKLIEQG